jgi:hypothetical protein
LNTSPEFEGSDSAALAVIAVGCIIGTLLFNVGTKENAITDNTADDVIIFLIFIVFPPVMKNKTLKCNYISFVFQALSHLTFAILAIMSSFFNKSGANSPKSGVSSNAVNS